MRDAFWGAAQRRGMMDRVRMRACPATSSGDDCGVVAWRRRARGLEAAPTLSSKQKALREESWGEFRSGLGSIIFYYLVRSLVVLLCDAACIGWKRTQAEALVALCLTQTRTGKGDRASWEIGFFWVVSRDTVGGEEFGGRRCGGHRVGNHTTRSKAHHPQHTHAQTSLS